MTNLIKARRGKAHALEAIASLLEEARNYRRVAQRLRRSSDPARYITLIRMCDERAEQIRDTARRRAELHGLGFAVIEQQCLPIARRRTA